MELFLKLVLETTNHHFLKFHVMLKWTVIFLIVAIVAGIFGFGGIAAGAAGIAKILFFIFLVLFLGGMMIWIAVAIFLPLYDQGMALE